MLFQVYRLLFPTPVLINEQREGGSIYFSANREVTLFPSDCVTVRWNVENINQVYLNDQPQIGSGEKRICQIETPPALTVHFLDSTEHTYRLYITSLSTDLLSYLTILLALVSAVLRWRNLLPLIEHPLRLAIVVITLFVVLFLFAALVLPLSETTATGTWVEASDATRKMITGLALFIFLLVVSASMSQVILLPAPSVPVASQHQRIGIAWLLGLITTLIIVASLILVVNPRGMYFSTSYAPYELLLRGTKMEGYQQLPHIPDIVIMGSSRAFTLSPNEVQSATGLTAYNMAVEGGRIEDFLIQTRQMSFNLPEVLFIEVQEGLPRQPNDIAARAPLTSLPYMSFDTALLTLEKRLTGLFNLHQFAESIYTARYYPIYSREPKEWPSFQPDGLALRPLLSAAELEQAVLLDIGRIPPPRCSQVDSASISDLEQIITTASNQGAAVVIYLSPWHPQYYESVMEYDSQYQTCYAATTAYLGNISQTYPNTLFVDLSRLENISGLDDENGYYDSQHLTEENSRRLINQAAQTLLQAFHVAQDN